MVYRNNHKWRLQLSSLQLLRPVLRNHSLDVIELQLSAKQDQVILDLSEFLVLLRNSIDVGQETVDLGSGEIGVGLHFLQNELLEGKSYFLVSELLGLL